MSEEGRWELPLTWVWARANEFSNVVGGGTPQDAKQPDNYAANGIPWITPADLSGYKAAHISRGSRDLSKRGFASCSARLLPRGTVLLSSRAPVGYCVVASNDICTNQGFKSFVLGSNELCPEYLRYYLIASKPYLESEASGTTFLELSGSRAAQLLFPIAPAREQVRIVSKIDELFSEIGEGERALGRVQKLMERYRQSVLKAAVTGNLTREWRERHKGKLETGAALLARLLQAHRASWEKGELNKMGAKGVIPTNDKWHQKYKELSPPRASDLPQMPDGWVWATVEQVGEVRLGRQRAPQHHTGDHMRPYLRVANVYEDRLELNDVKEMNFTPQEFKTYALRAGDILLNEGQSPELVGRPAMYRDEIPGCCYQKTLLRFRAYNGISSDFALLVFRSYLHNGRFRRSANITTSIAHLAAERFVQIEFPVPCAEEQSEIVETTTKMLGMLAHLEHEVIVQQRRVKSLRRSILAAAFTGRLTKQDKNDEPAANLVERIGAERGAGLVANPKRDQRMKAGEAG